MENSENFEHSYWYLPGGSRKRAGGVNNSENFEHSYWYLPNRQKAFERTVVAPGEMNELNERAPGAVTVKIAPSFRMFS